MLERINAIFNGTPIAVLADYLDERKHPDAPTIRYLEDPIAVVRNLLGNGLPVVGALSLPIENRLKLEFVLQPFLHSEPNYCRLACDFAEHVLPNFEDWNSCDLRPRNAIELSRCRLHRVVTDTDRDEAWRGAGFAAGSASSAGNHCAGHAAWAAQAAIGRVCDAQKASRNARLSAGDHETEWQLRQIQRILHDGE